MVTVTARNVHSKSGNVPNIDGAVVGSLDSPGRYSCLPPTLPNSMLLNQLLIAGTSTCLVEQSLRFSSAKLCCKRAVLWYSEVGLF